MLNYLLLFILLSSALCDSLASSPSNIIVIMTDDQDQVLGGMNPMKNVEQLIGNQGVTFTNSYANVPICCPSRSSMLTGLYVHNHRTFNNSQNGGCNSHRWQQIEHYTFAKFLHGRGYKTFYAGKYLNQYGSKHSGGPEHVPPGWSDWHGLVGNSVYYNYTLSNNGVPEKFTDKYLTDVIRDLSLKFIEDQKAADTPFMMMIAPPAPHQPFTPAERHKGKFSNVTAVRNPNFNIAANDKHWLMRMPPSPLPESMMAELDRAYRSRWEALLSVDEMVGDIVEALDRNSMLDNTYLIYTSDNGYHVGQFSQVYDKRQPYESDIKVPLLIKGPNVPKNVKSLQPVLNIDLAPTILQLAGISPPVAMDGHVIDFNDVSMRERVMLIQYMGEGSENTVDSKCPWKYDGQNLAECYPQYDCKCQDAVNNTFFCLRHIAEWTDFKYCEFAETEGFTEIYDLAKDPYELTNIDDEVFPAIKNWYRQLLKKMLGCRGASNCDNPLNELYISPTVIRI